MSLELLAIAFGLSTFSDSLVGRRIFLWSDNTGSEYAVRRGSARCFDHCCLVHSILMKALDLKAELVVDRVPTDVNVADLPSREEYQLLLDLGARFVPPVLDERFYDPMAWEALSLKKMF